MSKNKAFIDAGQIKIVNSNGMEYASSIAKQKNIASKLNYLTHIFLIAAISSILTSFSPLFFDLIFGWQIFFFFLCSVFFSFLMSFSSNLFEQNEEELNKLISSYNLAKNELQSDIMILEKEIAKHNSEIYQLHITNKFSFKKTSTKENTA